VSKRFPDLPRGLLREQQRQAIALLSLLWCFVVLLFHLPGLAEGHVQNLARHAFFHLFVAAWLALLFLRVRTLSSRDIAAYWFVGFYPVSLIVILLTKPAKWLLGTSGLVDAFWIPLAEEAIKIAPLLLLVWAANRRADHQFSVTDLGLLGFAIGAGFSFHEDALWSRVTADGFGGSLATVLFPTITDRAGGFLSAGTYAAGHGVWGAFAGLGVGLWWLLRKHRAALLLGAVPFALVVLDHMRANARGWGERILDPLLLDGRLVPMALMIMLPLVLMLELMIGRWGDHRDAVFSRVSLRELLTAGNRGEGWLQRIDRWAARQAYQRTRNSFHLEMWRTDGAEDGRGDGSALTALTILAKHGGVGNPSPKRPHLS
jgi:hypothetical protein